jgi:acetolactate synthase-1/2/3 large subunit
MKISDYIVGFLIEKGITDVFGIPGGVVLDFLYALEKKKGEISVHLNYHEQSSAFAACGYAQVSGKLGVAYATKGPGFTNLVTAIADSYHNSVPVFYITAHSSIKTPEGMRFEQIQELDTVQIAKSITKYAVRLTEPEDIPRQLEDAYQMALSGRPGPVLLDFWTNLFKDDIQIGIIKAEQYKDISFDSNEKIIAAIEVSVGISKRPVLLIGDGIRQSCSWEPLKKLVEKLQIPVISSRSAQDIIPDSKYYYGYIGSHGIRYSNFIVSKCDLVIALGNRVAYDPHSESFAEFTRQARIIRIDIDKNEFKRELPNTINFYADLKTLMPLFAEKAWHQVTHKEWIQVCDELKNILYSYDTGYPVSAITEILKKTNEAMVITSDVGNNEMWLARAYTFSGSINRILYSNNFGTLGCSLPKAIGAYYASGKRVMCFTGDQGIQFNLQELQYIVHEKLPIYIIILNNESSGMIRERQKASAFPYYVHTTIKSGYSAPDFKAIADTFSIPYYEINEKNGCFDGLFMKDGPVVLEIKINEAIDVLPILPKRCPCQDFEPQLDRTLFNYLNMR